MATARSFFHPQVVQALSDLIDPKKSVCLSLKDGKAAGKLDLIHQMYPPEGVHRCQIPACYTFILDEYEGGTFPIRVTEELKLMISLSDTGDGGDGLIFGYIAHEHWEEVESPHRFVAVKYNPVSRKGFVYLYNEAYDVLKEMNKDDLEKLRRRRAEEA